MQQGSVPPQVIPEDCLSEISAWYGSSRHLGLAGQYLDSEIAEFLEAWPWFLRIMEPNLLMVWLRLLHWLSQAERRTNCCLDCPAPGKEDGNVNQSLMFDYWKLSECLTCFKRISASVTDWDAGSSAGMPESRGTSWEMIDNSCVLIVACWMIKSNQK